MRKITKGKEPQYLLEYRKLPGASYTDFREKDALRESIVMEQHGLCCYCMGRISPTESGMKIEHCLSQDAHSDQQLNYRNLLGACKGGEGRSKEDQHCDTKKGGQSLSFNPADLDFDIETKVTFLSDGGISSSDTSINQELNDILNLNLDWLKTARKAALVDFQKHLKNGSKLDAAKELPRWNGSRSGKLPPYASVVVFYLRKKLLRQK